MSFLGSSWHIDDLLTFYLNTQRFDTGNATDADAAPSYRVYEDETGTAILTGTMALLDSSNTAGFYSEQITLSAANGFEVGKCYAIYIAATVNSVAGAMHHTFTIAPDVVDANLTQIDGNATSGNNATLNLKQLNVVNSAGDAAVFSSTGSNGVGINTSGNGSGAGLYTKGGATGPGVYAEGGDTSGAGIVGAAAAGDSRGITGHGSGAGYGICGEGGATGAGIHGLGGATSGDGIKGEAQTDGAGLKAVKAGAHTDIEGNLAGDITGSLSGSVGSVTGAVGSVTGNVGGNVTGSVGSVVGNVGGNVTGSVGSVVGAVGSVTGNVGGNVTGSVGSVAGNVGGNLVGNVNGNVVGSVGSIAANGIDDVSFTLAALAELQALVLSDATPFPGADIDAAISTRATQAQILSDATPFAGASIAAIKAKTDNLPESFKKNTAFNDFEFLMVLASDHVSPATGLTVSASRSIDGGAFAACANGVTEVGNGIYKLNLATTDLNGNFITFRFTAATADDTLVSIKTAL